MIAFGRIQYTYIHFKERRFPTNKICVHHTHQRTYKVGLPKMAYLMFGPGLSTNTK